MPTRPTSTPLEWATDATHPAGANAWSGLANKTTPSAGRIAQGLEPTDNPPAEWVNEAWNGFGEWTSYLKDIADTYWVDSRTVCVTLRAYLGPSNNWGLASSYGHPASLANAGVLEYDLNPYLPQGADLQDIKMHALPGAARASAALRFDFIVHAYDVTDPSQVPGITRYDSAQANTSAVQEISLSAQNLVGGSAWPGNLVIDKTNHGYFLRVTAGTDGSHATDNLYAIELTYDHPFNV